MFLIFVARANNKNQKFSDLRYNYSIITAYCSHFFARPYIQFICGLMVCCGSAAHLTREEIQRIVNYYRCPDGRVKYKEFCHLMENCKLLESVNMSLDKCDPFDSSVGRAVDCRGGGHP